MATGWLGRGAKAHMRDRDEWGLEGRDGDGVLRVGGGVWHGRMWLNVRWLWRRTRGWESGSVAGRGVGDEGHQGYMQHSI